MSNLVAGGESSRLLRGIATSTLARISSAVAPLITVPIALGALGVNGYGAWVAALSLTGFVAFADLGLGSGLVTTLPRLVATGDYRTARQYVTGAYVTLGILSALVVIGLVTSAQFVDWGTAVGEADSASASAIVLVTLLAFAANIVISLVVRVQQGMQAVALSYVWQTAGAIIGIVAMVLAAALGARGVAFIVVAAFAPVMVGLINSASFFAIGDGRSVSPTLEAFRWSAVKELMNLGSRFLLIFLLMSAALGTDVWIVGRTAGLGAASTYAIPARVFAVISTAATAVAAPLWPVAAHALAAGRRQWTVRAVRKLTLYSVIVVVALSATAVVLTPWVFSWWLHDSIKPGLVLLIGLAASNIVQCSVGPMFMVQNAARVLWPQTVGYALLLIALPLKWWVAQAWGYDWIPYVTVVGYCALIWPAVLVGFRRALASPVES